MNGRNEQDRRRLVMLYSIGFALLAICSILSLRLGAVATPFHEIWSDLRAGEGLVFDYRMPRLLAAIMVGMNLAVAGSMMQSITRNPMAAPDLIGINAGAGLVIVCLILIVPSFSAFTLPVAAFAGAAAAGGLVYLLAYQKSGTSHGRLVLSGLAVGGGLQALITFILVKYAPDASQALIFLKGSFYARSWLHVEMLLPWTLVCVPLAFLSSRYLSALQLGEDTVAGLGIRADRARLLLLGLVVALAGSAVAVAGTIAFVGLIVPHLVKSLAGPDPKRALPLAALFGALLVVISDMVGRIIVPPAEIPAGIITALLGAPYFLYLLVRRA